MALPTRSVGAGARVRPGQWGQSKFCNGGMPKVHLQPSARTLKIAGSVHVQVDHLTTALAIQNQGATASTRGVNNPDLSSHAVHL
jgi:hypothetical protein